MWDDVFLTAWGLISAPFIFAWGYIGHILFWLLMVVLFFVVMFGWFAAETENSLGGSCLALLSLLLMIILFVSYATVMGW